MNAKRIIYIVLASILVLVLVLGGTVAWYATSGFRPPVTVAEPAYWPTNGWRVTTPEAAGYSSRVASDALLEMRQKGVAIDSLMIVRNGYVALDAYFAPYDGSFAHNLASVTKSVMTTLIGIAADQGKIDLDKPMVAYFPDRTIANLDERKARITVRQLASMVNGMESGCFQDDPGTLARMRSHPDWLQAALDRPMVEEPGTKFCYDSPGMHILSGILQEATGQTALEFGQQYLFEPLGIHDAIWDVDPQSYNRGWGDLYLTPASAAKIGFLWLHKGNWDGKQIVSQEWVLGSVHPQIRPVDHDYAYGYGMWLNNSAYFAAGRGGQEIRVFPAWNTVMVITGGGYEYSDIEGFVTPSLILSLIPRADNPQGQAALQDTLKTLREPVDYPAVTSTPQIAKEITGKMYQCENNPAGLESMTLDFADPSAATLRQRVQGQDILWTIGLDGHHRIIADGDALVGYWEDEHTFHLEVFDVGTQVYQVQFEGTRAQVIIEGADLSISCRTATP